MGSGDNEVKEDSEGSEYRGDYLGYGVYAETLWARIEAALDKDGGDVNKLGDDPLVVGLFGEWGAGKSKLLKLILEKAEKLASQKERARSGKDGGFGDAGFSLTVPVLFQPWKYEHETNLLVPLLIHIVQALNETARRGQTPGEDLVQKAQTAGDKAFAALPEIVKSFELLHNNVAVDLALVADPTGAGALLKTAGWLATLKKKASLPQTSLKKDFKFTTDGRFYYNFHQALKEVTRPGGNPTVLNDIKLRKDIRINFVIFIDDLDRCLPEKAVEALELIKTVFNLESFAFVLALDEEVVERGIGHRYKDYALVNKKPEMPITGFEYLEKIVHLPFRLPGLTKDQAHQFLVRYESEEVAPHQPERWWFAPRPVIDQEKTRSNELAPMQVSERNKAANSDISSLVLSAFTTYVPRKLVRLIELLHQVQEISLRRGKVITLGGDSGSDIRVLMALVMIQLFQPDLYRLVRRKPQALPLLLAAFAKRGSGYKDFSDPDISDVDLWLWVVGESAGKGNDWIQTCSISEAMNAVVRRIATNYHVVTNHGLPVQYEVHNEDGEEITVTEFDTVKTRQRRSISQNVKLPLVAHIVEHRAAQRHAFDPLRLMHALASALETGWSGKDGVDVSPAASLQIAPYFSLMLPVTDPHWDLYFGPPKSFSSGEGENSARTDSDVAETVSGATPLKARASGRVADTQPVRFPDRLFADLINDQTEVQANLLADNELEPGKLMESDAAQALLQKLKHWKQMHKSLDDNALLIRGLRVIAPLLPRDLGKEFLHLVDSQESPPWLLNSEETFKNKEEVQEALDRAELWGALGQDQRFDPERFYLPRQRMSSNERNTEREPIPGFVRVFENKQEIFQPFEGPSVTLKPYYMARYLTTVDQYACFVDDGGYGEIGETKPAWWDTLGWAWRTGRWDSQVKEGAYREHLDRRKPELRGAPMRWIQQLSQGSLPVTQLNWFEARAYARWLTDQLQKELRVRLPGFSVRLPTEAQWERAARASDRTESDTRQYPWGGDDQKTAHLRANIGPSDIDRPSAVGLFASNPLGLCDLSGNVWEWQNNLFLSDGDGQHAGLTSDVSDLKTHEEIDKCDRPALRGGSWNDTAGNARASIRDWNLPVSWYYFVGFRVVLSLANLPSET